MHVGEASSPRAPTTALLGEVGLKAVELFAGAGGLALGVSEAGFEHLALIELERNACETIRENQRRGHSLAKAWPLQEVDVREFDYGQIRGGVDLLTAGVPCQPFSVAGKGRAHDDQRDMFSEVVRAAQELRPKAILIENVKGLVRSTFRDYFDYLLLAITSPDFERNGNESWREHFKCLRKHGDQTDGLRYDVRVHTLNAADYGVPQWRERVFIVAFRSDLGVQWSAPQATHSLDVLIWSQYVTKEYWQRHGLKRERPGLMTRRFADRLRLLRELDRLEDTRLPWRTVRDAISDLPCLRQGQESPVVPNHFLNPGARAYSRHSGSLMDEPAKTLKAGSHGVPGGENTLALGRGRVRYFSVRECARFQSFPDDYVFTGAWTRAMRQVGNAVPVTIGRLIAERIGNHIVMTTRALVGNGRGAAPTESLSVGARAGDGERIAASTPCTVTPGQLLRSLPSDRATSNHQETSERAGRRLGPTRGGAS